MAKAKEKIRMLGTIQHGRMQYVGGNVYEVDEATAKVLLSTKKKGTGKPLAKIVGSDDDDATVTPAPKTPFAPPAKDEKFSSDADDKNKPFVPPGEDENELDGDDEEVDESEDEEESDSEDQDEKVRKPRKKKRRK